MDSLYLAEQAAFIRWHQVGMDGPPIVYLPGLSIAAAGAFLPCVTLPALATTRAILIDYFGSGVSDTPAEFDGSLAAHARSIAAVLDHLGLGPCPVVGHSMGGTVAIELALQRPDLVTHLVVGEGNLFPGGGVATAHFASFSEADFVAEVFPRVLAKLRQSGIDGDSGDAFLAAAWQMADPAILHRNSKALVGLPADFADRFFRLTLPRLFVYGEQDYPSDAKPHSADVPDPDLLQSHGIRTAVLANAGHSLMRANPAGFADILADQLCR